MVIGSSPRFRTVKSTPLLLLALLGFSGMTASADDQLIKKDGTTVSGHINGVSGGQVSLTQGSAKTVVYLSDLKSAVMTPPAEISTVKDATPAQVVAALEPLTQQYAGLPADWVLDAMGQLADAYNAENQPDKASAVYAQINKLYPGSPYQKEAVVGQAKINVQVDKIEEAMSEVKPLIEQANQNIAPSPAEGRLFAGAFLVYGQALEAQKQYAQALEAYLTVKTMFYQSPTLVAQADKQAKALVAQQPNVSVD